MFLINQTEMFLRRRISVHLRSPDCADTVNPFTLIYYAFQLRPRSAISLRLRRAIQRRLGSSQLTRRDGGIRSAGRS